MFKPEAGRLAQPQHAIARFTLRPRSFPNAHKDSWHSRITGVPRVYRFQFQAGDIKHRRSCDQQEHEAVARSLIDLGTQTINSERPAHVAAVFLGVNLSTTLATQRIDQAAALGDILCKCESRLSSLLNAHGLALSVFKRAISFGFNLHRPG
jgi:hypothetical protein